MPLLSNVPLKSTLQDGRLGSVLSLRGYDMRLPEQSFWGES